MKGDHGILGDGRDTRHVVCEPVRVTSLGNRRRICDIATGGMMVFALLEDVNPIPKEHTHKEKKSEELKVRNNL